MLGFFGIFSAILFLAGCFPYVRDILRKTNKPERASWFIWLVLAAISFFAQMAEGATWSLWLPASFVLGDLIIFILAIKYGVGGFRKRDYIALVASAIGLFLWYITSHAYLSIIITILIDLIGYQLIVLKIFEFPKSETLSAWICFALCGLFGALSVGSLNLIYYLFRLYTYCSQMLQW